MSSDEDLYNDDEYYDNDKSDNELWSDNEAPSRKNYKVLTPTEIRGRVTDDVAAVSALLSVPPASAALLLHRHRWSQEDVHNAWFSDEAKARESVGLVHYETHLVESFQCGICFENYKYLEGAHAGCGHMFCNTCWRSYIGVSIEGGLVCLSLRCPDLSCAAAIDQDFVDRLGSEIDKEKYKDYLFRSYIEANLKTKWCPAPGCEMVVEFDHSANEGYDVLCLCSHRFCWKCSEEAHRPLVCDTVAKWIVKNTAESENVNWILAYTKPCPKCKKAIEKNNGCMHMTCMAPCYYQFCWVCLGAWQGHGDHACNRFRQEVAETEKRREMARHSLVRYTHYYERWVANENSRLKASEDLWNFETVKLEKLQLNLTKPVAELQFVTEAWVQIVECRRVLKWSYAYGYYIPEEEKAKLDFFEYLQGEAELGLERLHQCAEKDLEGFLGDEIKEDFYSFRRKLSTLTRVTQTYFENLVKALENGLSDVGSHCKQANEEAQKKRKREDDLADLDHQPGIQKQQYQIGWF